jgi:hypothetical protein
MANFRKCVSTMNEAAGRKLTDEELDWLFTHVSDAAREERAHLREPSQALSDAIATNAQQRARKAADARLMDVAMAVLRADASAKEAGLAAPEGAKVGRIRTAIANALDTASEVSPLVMFPSGALENLADMMRGTFRHAGPAKEAAYSAAGGDDVLQREAWRAVAEHPDLTMIGDDGKPMLISDMLRRTRNEAEADRRLFENPRLLEEAALCFLGGQL